MEDQKSQAENTTAPKVTGIGGIFFKCKDPKGTMEWYKTPFERSILLRSTMPVASRYCISVATESPL